MSKDNDITLAQFIGSNIKKLRDKRAEELGKSFSQKECAENIGASQQQWAAWESGKNIPGDEYLKEIAGFFGINKINLWTRHNKNSPPSESRRSFDIDPIDIVFSLQKSLAGFQLLLADAGRYVADGRSLRTYEDLHGLLETIRGVKDLCESVSKRLESYRQDDGNHGRPA